MPVELRLKFMAVVGSDFFAAEWKSINGMVEEVDGTPPQIVEKVLYLLAKYHLAPIRIVWNLARYRDIKISEAGVSRVFGRNGASRLPRGAHMRKIHTTRYNKQVPGHHILDRTSPSIALASSHH